MLVTESCELIVPFEQRYDPESVRKAFFVVKETWQKRIDVAIEQRDKAREEAYQQMRKCAHAEMDVDSLQWRLGMLRAQLAKEKDKNAELQLKLQDAEQKLAKMQTLSLWASADAVSFILWSVNGCQLVYAIMWSVNSSWNAMSQQHRDHFVVCKQKCYQVLVLCTGINIYGPIFIMVLLCTEMFLESLPSKYNGSGMVLEHGVCTVNGSGKWCMH